MRLRFALLLILPLVVIADCQDDRPHVGSLDCKTLRLTTNDAFTHRLCEACQGVGCEKRGCDIFPCIDDVRVVQVCETDKDCSRFEGMLCGKYSAPDHVCSSHPDDI